MSSTTAPLFPAGARPLQGQRDAAAGGGGSYTPVFVVLGVIAALLVISCLVGQVCTKRHLRPRRPRRDRVAYYDDDMEAAGGFGAHGPPPHHGIAKMEAPPPAPSVETRAAAGDGAAAVAVQQPSSTT
ncbi:hypothetical protein GQ55_3G166700 [Panicum hallii var. hallii]|uniref:Uncharacterized protein n=1 Tax=Panicum hallii var. hallii TaxID=1504633 RepID=A0A2T7EA99_9POAL|nr:hypothetical protein GQ55_3G166700 [Panicum hallii var. hallii]